MPEQIYFAGYWRVGDLVKLSDEGLAANLGPKTRFNTTMRATVVKVHSLPSGRVMSINVQKVGYKTVGRYYAGFWRHNSDRKAARRAEATHA